MAALLIS